MTEQGKRLAKFVAQGGNTLKFLTPMGERFVKELASGKTHKEVATLYGRSESYVRKHANRAERKLETRERLQPPDQPTFVLVRLYTEVKEYGAPVKCEVVAQGNKETVDVALLNARKNGTCFVFVERHDVEAGDYLFCIPQS